MQNRCLKLLSLYNLLHSKDRGTSPSHSPLVLWASTTLVSPWNHHAPLSGCHATSRCKFHVPVLLSIFHSPYLLKTYTFFMLKPNHLQYQYYSVATVCCSLIPSKVDQAILFFPLYFISFIRAGKFTVSSSLLQVVCKSFSIILLAEK